MLSRRALLQGAALSLAARWWPRPATDDRATLAAWLRTLRDEGLAAADVPLGRAVARAGELALGAPYAAGTLEAYLRAGGRPEDEPLTIHLDRFDCVSLVESCLAAARAARVPEGGWAAFAAALTEMRYRGGVRDGYLSRLHYWSEWIADNARRGLVADLGEALGGTPDRRPLRFMSAHRDAYPALADDATLRRIADLERARDGAPRHVVPRERIPAILPALRTGDLLAFATSIEGLDVTHTGLAYRDRAGTVRVLHAPLSGGAVEVSAGDLPAYVTAIRRCTGLLVARPT